MIAPDIITAEVYAKALLIAGEKDMLRLLSVRPDLTFIAVDAEGNLSGSANYKEYMYELTSEPF